MKIVITGGGTGGHFYPLLAVIESVYDLCDKEQMIHPAVKFYSTDIYNERALINYNIGFEQIPAGKLRLGANPSNILDIFKTMFGVFVAFFKLLSDYPDVIFSKGGYASVPTVIAGFVLRIPIIIHDSDSIPGRATLLASKLASRIALSYEDASIYFKGKSLALTGQPIMKKITPNSDFNRVYNKDKKTILILGGSLGSQTINSVIIDVLPELLKKYNVIHQTGQDNYEDVKKVTDNLREIDNNRDSYYLQANLELSKIYPSTDLCITRAGSSLFELINYQIPSIIVPIPESISRDQRSNAYATMKKGCGVVIEQDNFTSHLLLTELSRILDDENLYNKMVKNCKNNTVLDASNIIGKEIIKILKSHINN